jgi:arylformamidase
VPHYRVADWDDAYANGVNIPRGEAWPEAWVNPARTFKEKLGQRAELDIAYGSHQRQRFDLFLPEGAPKGLVIFIHGGYWKAFDKSYWSHLAAGAVTAGFACAMPSYRLCPEVRLSEIVQDASAAVTAAAARIAGPLYLAGHSAGGHLATRLVSAPSPLPAAVLRRLRHVVSISGLHDLRPLMKTTMNETLHIDAAEAREQSPALLAPCQALRLTCWVGAAERAEFRRQNALLSNVWTGLGTETCAVEEPDRHHFNIIDGLCDASHDLLRTLIS